MITSQYFNYIERIGTFDNFNIGGTKYPMDRNTRKIMRDYYRFRRTYSNRNFVRLCMINDIKGY